MLPLHHKRALPCFYRAFVLSLRDGINHSRYEISYGFYAWWGWNEGNFLISLQFHFVKAPLKKNVFIRFPSCLLHKFVGVNAETKKVVQTKRCSIISPLKFVIWLKKLWLRRQRTLKQHILCIFLSSLFPSVLYFYIWIGFISI